MGEPKIKKRPKQTIEKPGKAREKKPTIKDYAKKAKKLESDPNVKAAEAIKELEGFKETVKQLEGLTALNTAIVSILTKLAKKGVDLKKIKTAKDLQREVLKNGLKLNLPEATALENLDRIASQSGPTATEVKNSWPDRVEAAEEASKGYWDKYKENLNKNVR